MKDKLLIFIILVAFVGFSACGRWNPATVQDMRTTVEQKKKKAGDRYRFLDSSGKTMVVSGKNMNLDGDDLIVRKDSQQYRIPLDQTQKIEKYKINTGATIGTVLGISAGVIALSILAGFLAAGDDSGS